MNPIILAIILGTVFVLTLILRVVLKSRVRRIPPQTRYRIFAVLGGIGILAQGFGAWIEVASGHTGLAVVFLAICLLLGVGCVLEMRKLSREF